MPTTCPACPRQQVDGLLCHHCCLLLERDLRAVPALVEDLQLTLARQGRTTTATPGGLAHERTGYHQGASDALAALERTLTAWSAGIGRPAWYSTTAAHQLLNNLDALRSHRDADKAHAEITRAISDARRVIDQSANRTIIPVGPCPEANCSSTVYAYIPTEDTRPARMECRDNPSHRWEPHQWLRAGKRILDRKAELKRGVA
jgi:hypothetical protein